MVAGGFGNCQAKVGMLVLRECGQSAVRVCQMCNKPICEAHQNQTKQGIICPDCAAGLPGEQVSPQAERARRRGFYYGQYGYHPHHYHDHDYQTLDRSEAATARTAGTVVAVAAGAAAAHGLTDHDYTES